MELSEDGVTDVARRLEAEFGLGPDAGQAALSSLYADQVELRHVPALPSDGLVGGPELAAGTACEAETIRGAIVDMRYEDVSVSVDDGRVRVTVMIVGTLASGDQVRLPTDMRCTVRGGRIVGMEHHLGADAMAAWSAVFAAGPVVAPAGDVRQHSGTDVGGRA